MHAAAIRGLPSRQPAAQAPASGRSVLSRRAILKLPVRAPFPPVTAKIRRVRVGGPSQANPGDLIAICHHVAIDQLKSPGLG